MPSPKPFSRDYLLRLLRFAIRSQPFVLGNVVLALLSVILELAAVAIVLPLSTIAAGGTIAADSQWGRLLGLFGIQAAFATLLLCFIAIFSLRLITNFLNQSTSIFIGKRLQADLSSRAFARLVKDMSLRDIDSRSAGHFISLAGDETARAGAVVTGLNQTLAAVFMAGVYFIGILLFSSWLAAAVAIFLVVALLGLKGILRRSQALSARQLEEVKVAHSVFLDALNGLRSVRALSAEAFVTSRYDQIIRRYTKTYFVIDTLTLAVKVLPALVLLFCVGIAAWAGRLEVASPGALAALATGLALLLRFFPASGQILTLGMRLLADLRGASDVTHLLDEPTGPAQGPRSALKQPVELLELRRVAFAYKPSHPVLRDFSAQFGRGHVYALVGPSGSGKTTILDLLLGFYVPDSGEVLANGIPVRHLDSSSLRSRVILVGQQITILNDSVMNNIRFGSDAPLEAVEKACQIACIDEYIAALPLGYDTVLSYQGSNLSGGQRQRIAMARALLRDPDVLLLDESTSGLDAQTRDRVVGNIVDVYRNRIVIFATHDEALISGVHHVVALPNPPLPEEATAALAKDPA